MAGGRQSSSAGRKPLFASLFNHAARSRRRALETDCNGNAAGDRLEAILAPHRAGVTPITLHYENNGVGGDFELPESWRVNLDDALIERLREWLSPSNVTIVY